MQRYWFFSNNRSDAGINLSFEVKIILNGSGKCFADSVFNISRVSEWEEKDAIAFSEQMIVGYDILLMAKGMGKFFEGGGRGNVKWMVYKEVAILQSCNLAILQPCKMVYFTRWIYN